MKIAVFGAGAYGISLALACYYNHHQVTLWTKVLDEEKMILDTRENTSALPGVKIPLEIKVTTDLEVVMRENDYIILAIPIAFLRSTLIDISTYHNDNKRYLIATKGIEQHTNFLLHQIFLDVIPNGEFGVIAGPTFAVDLANQELSGLNIASSFSCVISSFTHALASRRITIQAMDDIIGIECCSSLKNVMAIGAGILDGLMVSETTRALFYTDAILGIGTFIDLMGGNSNTLLSLSGIGDFILTCTSVKSRNFRLGLVLATGDSIKIKSFMDNNTIEGLYTIQSVYSIMQDKNVSIPIIDILYQIIMGLEQPKRLLDFLVGIK